MARIQFPQNKNQRFIIITVSVLVLALVIAYFLPAPIASLQTVRTAMAGVKSYTFAISGNWENLKNGSSYPEIAFSYSGSANAEKFPSALLDSELKIESPGGREDLDIKILLRNVGSQIYLKAERLRSSVLERNNINLSLLAEKWMSAPALTGENKIDNNPDLGAEAAADLFGWALKAGAITATPTFGESRVRGVRVSALALHLKEETLKEFINLIVSDAHFENLMKISAQPISKQELRENISKLLSFIAKSDITVWIDRQGYVRRLRLAHADSKSKFTINAFLFNYNQPLAIIAPSGAVTVTEIIEQFKKVYSRQIPAGIPSFTPAPNLIPRR